MLQTTGFSLRRLAAIAIIASLFVSITRTGSIFDDDWVPPPPRKVAPPVNEPVIPPAQTPERSREKSEKPATGPAAESTSTPPAKRRPVPEKAAQARSRKLFKEVYQKELADRSPAARRKLAAQLMQEAGKTTDVSSDEFVLLVGATEAAREGSDLGQCVAASEALASKYEVDALQLKLDAALKTTLRADAKDVTQHNVSTGIELVNQLVAGDDYGSAQRVLNMLRPAAAVDPSLATVIERMSRDVECKRVFVDRLPAQMAKLRTMPDDPGANLAYGKYLAMIKSNWDGGAPLLVKGSDALIKAAATLDIKQPTDGDAQIEVADTWWAAAEKDKTWLGSSMRERAAYWYSLALKDVKVVGLARKHVEQRVAEAGTSFAAARPGQRAGPRKVLLFKQHDWEERTFTALGGGAPKIISKADAPAVLADPDSFAQVAIVVWGPERWHSVPIEAMTDSVRRGIQQFVHDGGDWIMFEQFGAGNMGVIDQMFGLRTRGGVKGATIVSPALDAKLNAVGYPTADLATVRFYNSYEGLPKGSVVLVKCGDHNGAVVVPYGKGRLILIGTGIDPPDQPIDQAVLELVYGLPPLSDR